MSSHSLMVLTWVTGTITFVLVVFACFIEKSREYLIGIAALIATVFAVFLTMYFEDAGKQAENKEIAARMVDDYGMTELLLRHREIDAWRGYFSRLRSSADANHEWLAAQLNLPTYRDMAFLDDLIKSNHVQAFAPTGFMAFLASVRMEEGKLLQVARTSDKPIDERIDALEQYQTLIDNTWIKLCDVKRQMADAIHPFPYATCDVTVGFERLDKTYQDFTANVQVVKASN